MFIHLLAGSLTFLLLGRVLNIEINGAFLLLGGFLGLAPDLTSYILSRGIKFNKWTHIHRDNLSHSVFFPVLVLIAVSFFDLKLAIVASVAVLTHPLFDLFGIGWGVKLFYPFSNKTYKMFYQGRFLTVWEQKEVENEAERSGDDNWVKNIYFKPSLAGILEWLFLIAFLLLVIVSWR